MKTAKNYITEKLRINKDTENKTLSDSTILDNEKDIWYITLSFIHRFVSDFDTYKIKVTYKLLDRDKEEYPHVEIYFKERYPKQLISQFVHREMEKEIVKLKFKDTYIYIDMIDFDPIDRKLVFYFNQ